MTMLYNTATTSTVGPQIYADFYYKRALVEAAKEAYFGQLADVTSMPKHFGKTIKLFHYLPILDDRNINDQGIDAGGINTQAGFVATETYLKHVISVTAPAALGGMTYYFEGLATGADAATAAGLAEVLAQGKVRGWAATIGITGAAYANVATALGNAGYTVDANEVDSVTAAGASYGNIYGSSKDVGTITGKLPALSETGGRVNRVGMKRLTIEGTIEKFGFFEEYSQDSLDFDNDMELEGHITSEAVKAANEITEDQLQIDLLNGAGVVRFTGNAVSVATLNGGTAAQLAAGTTLDLMTYDDLVKLGIELDNNRTPKNTKVITGSRMIDTRVVNGARYAYIGSELLPTIMRMTDYHGERAFIPVAQYGAATTVARGEVGAVADFRFIVVPEMMHWEASGANVSDVTDEACYWSSDSTGQAKVNVYPVLVVGDGSFTTIGFQTDGKTVKFKIKHVKPGSDSSYSRDDPYGELGYYSIKWWYGSMITRPERLAVIKTVAVM